MIRKRRDLSPIDRVARAIWMASPNGGGATEREWEGVERNWPEDANVYRTLARAVIGEMHDIVSDMLVEPEIPQAKVRAGNDTYPARARFAR
jgi:hypothetical protein